MAAVEGLIRVEKTETEFDGARLPNITEIMPISTKLNRGFLELLLGRGDQIIFVKKRI